MKSADSALAYDELIASVARVLEEGQAPTASYGYALRALVEICVLHEVVYYDVSGGFTQGEPGRRSVGQLARGSRIAAALGDVLEPLPSEKEIDAELSRRARRYRFIDFISDFMWSSISFLVSPATEAEALDLLRQLVDQLPALFHSRDLIDHDGRPLAGKSRDAFRSGLPVDQLLILEAMCRRADSYVALGRRLDLPVYPSLGALPFHLGAVWKSNVEVATRYEADREGGTPFLGDMARVRCRRDGRPAVADRVLGRARADPDSLAEEILRERTDWQRGPHPSVDRPGTEPNGDGGGGGLSYQVWDRRTEGGAPAYSQTRWSLPELSEEAWSLLEGESLGANELWETTLESHRSYAGSLDEHLAQVYGLADTGAVAQQGDAR